MKKLCVLSHIALTIIGVDMPHLSPPLIQSDFPGL